MTSKGRGSVLICGAEGALGREAVIGFHRMGFRVIASARTEADMAKLDEFFAGQGVRGVRILVYNLASEDDVARLAKLTDEPHAGGPVAYMMNCAGAFRWVPTVQATTEDFDLLLSANLRSSWLLAKHILPFMTRRNFGRMVFVSARATQAPGEVGMGLYTAAKAGLNALIQSIAQEVRPYNINVNALLPTIIDTPANRREMPDRDHSTWVTPVTLVNLAAMLFSDTADQVNGSLITVPGRV